MSNLTSSQFTETLDFLQNLPISVSKAVDTSNTMSLASSRKSKGVENDDLPSYGIYILNKIMQSVVGTAHNKGVNIENNLLELSRQTEASVDDDKIKATNQRISDAIENISQLKSMFNWLETYQQRLINDEGLNIVTDETDANYSIYWEVPERCKTR